MMVYNKNSNKVIYILAFISILTFVILLNNVSAEDNLEKRICSKIYYFILRTNWNYTEKDLYNLGNELNISNVEKWIDNYWEWCYLQNLSSKLPKRNTGKLIINKNYSYDSECDIDVHEKEIGLDITIKLMDISIGKEIHCKKLSFLKYLFRINKIDENYYIDGIRLWFLCFLIVLFCAISLLTNSL